MINFDIESLFNNIPLQENIALSVENLFKDRNHVDILSKDSFCELLTKTMFKSLILLNQKFYKQYDRVGFPIRTYTYQSFCLLS